MEGVLGGLWWKEVCWEGYGRRRYVGRVMVEGISQEG